MGMTNDYEVAIEEGATMVRVVQESLVPEIMWFNRFLSKKVQNKGCSTVREHEIRSVKMGVFDKFLDIMKLNEDDYDDQYDEYDEGGFYDDDEYEEKPRHSFFGKKNNSSKEDSYKDLM